MSNDQKYRMKRAHQSKCHVPCCLNGATHRYATLMSATELAKT